MDWREQYGHEVTERRVRCKDVRTDKYPVSSPIQDQVTAREYLLKRGLDDGLATRNGWYASRAAGDDHLRLVIPARASDGHSFWQARAVGDEVKPRYTSPPYQRLDAVVTVWPEEKVGRAVVCEGPLDALAAAGVTAGPVGVVGIALMGATPPLAALARVADITAGLPVIVMPDRDKAFDQLGVRATNYLATRGRLVKVVVPLWPHKDLCEVPGAERGALVWPDQH
jgi:hypothetical protein